MSDLQSIHPTPWRNVYGKVLESGQATTVLDANGKIVLSNIPRIVADSIVGWANAEAAMVEHRLSVQPMEVGFEAFNPKTWPAEAWCGPTPSAAVNAAVKWLEPHKGCRSCGKVLLPENFGMVADGCPCNSPRGVNHGLVPKDTCTCPECDPAQTGSVRTMARIKFIDAFPWYLRPDSSCWLVVDRHGVTIASFPEKVIAEYVVTLANNDNRAMYASQDRRSYKGRFCS